MRQRFTLVLLIACLFAKAQNNPRRLQANIDSIFKGYTPPGRPGAAAPPVKDGNVIFKKGYGLANLEHDIPITPTTVFDIASVSKQFTGFAISMLIQQGKISPDDDIHKYLPWVPQFAQPITVGNLIHHTSGLRDWPEALHAAGWRWDEAFAWEDIMRMVKKQHDLDFVPGSQYQYSNTGYNLLAAIVEKITGKTLANWLDENLFKPLGMNSTQVLVDYSKVVKHLADSYYLDGGVYHRSNYELTGFGSSSMFTSVEDLSKLVIRFQKGLDEKDPVFLRMIETGKLNNGINNGYAYGLGISNANGVKNISHTGSWASYATVISTYPDEKLSIILLSNAGGFDSFGSANTVAKLFLKEQPRNGPQREDLGGKPTVNVDTVILRKYAGTYKLGTNWYVTLTLEDGKLMTQANGEDKFATEMKSDTVLWVPAYHSSMTFLQITDKANALRYRGNASPRITPVKIDISELSRYAGTYYSKELETTYRIALENGKLIAHHMRLGDFELNPDVITADSFSSSNGSIKFFKDGNKIAGFKLSGGRIRNIVFDKQ